MPCLSLSSLVSHGDDGEQEVPPKPGTRNLSPNLHTTPGKNAHLHPRPWWRCWTCCCVEGDVVSFSQVPWLQSGPPSPLPCSPLPHAWLTKRVSFLHCPCHPTFLLWLPAVSSRSWSEAWLHQLRLAEGSRKTVNLHAAWINTPHGS